MGYYYLIHVTAGVHWRRNGWSIAKHNYSFPCP